MTVRCSVLLSTCCIRCKFLLRRYNGWVTELKDQTKVQNVSEVAGIDNLLYSSDVDFSCFADLAVTSPVDYRKEGEGSLMQVVITPCEKYMPMTNEAIAEEMHQQVQKLFPSARSLKYTFHSVVKIGQSLYRCACNPSMQCHYAGPSCPPTQLDLCRSSLQDVAVAGVFWCWSDVTAASSIPASSVFVQGGTWTGSISA
jgi:uncharacterized protein with NAD-binding domain and iron-sulfur cluster